jgi:hypothetical protein
MRLAAMTGVDKELERFSETQRMRAAAPPVSPAGSSETDTWRELGPANNPVPAEKGRRRGVLYIWIAGAALVAAAAALLLLG